MTIAKEIEDLNQLKKLGAISERDYRQAREALLSIEPARERGNHAAPPPPPPPPPPPQRSAHPVSGGINIDHVGMSDNTWAMFLHLSQLMGHAVPLAGLIAPIVLWAIRKDESPLIDRHGRTVFNWLITSILLIFLCIPLIFIGIGIPLIIILGILIIVFPIIGAIKANAGEVWRYPMSICFFDVPEEDTCANAALAREPEVDDTDDPYDSRPTSEYD
ncbi:MAG: DUF4870 domain-containing protein [Planctomycetota bacterium]|jgi:uncharacterized Tic20 family protein